MQRSRWSKLLLGATLVIPAVAASANQTTASPQPQQPAPAKADRQSYVVVMAADPLAITHGQERLDTASADSRATRLESSHERVLRGAGATDAPITHTYTVALNGFSAQLTPTEVAEVQKQPGVAAVLEDVMRFPTTDSSGDFLGLTSPTARTPTASTGEDVVVGVIDTGIWPEHPSFADDGSCPLAADESRHRLRVRQHRAQPGRRPVHLQQQAPRRATRSLDTLPRRASAPSPTSSTRPATTTATARTRPRPRPATPASRRRSTASTVATVTRASRRERAGRSPTRRCGNGRAASRSDLAAAIDQAVADGVDVINYSIGGGAQPARRRRPRVPVRRRRRRVRRRLGRQRRPRRRHDRRPRPTARGSPRSARARRRARFHGHGHARQRRPSAVRRSRRASPQVAARRRAPTLGNPLCLPSDGALTAARSPARSCSASAA